LGGFVIDHAQPVAGGKQHALGGRQALQESAQIDARFEPLCGRGDGGERRAEVGLEDLEGDVSEVSESPGAMVNEAALAEGAEEPWRRILDVAPTLEGEESYGLEDIVCIIGRDLEEGEDAVDFGSQLLEEEEDLLR
jgi:hypothetical protein